MPQDTSNVLCSLLVQEFQIWQELYRLAGQDRRALLDCDLPALAQVSTRKAAHLSALSACQTSRQNLLDLVQADRGGDPIETQGKALQWLMDSLPAEQADGLMGLAQGIQTLVQRIGELVQGNYALADCAQRRLWLIQGWAQQEQQQSLPEMLTSFLNSPVESQPVPPVPAVQGELSSAVFGQYDHDFFAEMIAAGSQTSR